MLALEGWKGKGAVRVKTYFPEPTVQANNLADRY